MAEARHASPCAFVPAVLVVEGPSTGAASSTAPRNLDGVPDSYRAMNDREAIKVMTEL